MVQHTHSPRRAAESRDRGGEDFDDVEIVADEEWLGRGHAHRDSNTVAVPFDHSMTAAVAALVARAAAEHRPLDEVADDVVHGRLVLPVPDGPDMREGRVLDVEDWYAENDRRTDLLEEEDPIDADRWLYVHRDEVVGASSGAAVDLIRESGMIAHITRGKDVAPQSDMWDRGRIRLLVGDDGTVRSADWG